MTAVKNIFQSHFFFEKWSIEPIQAIFLHSDIHQRQSLNINISKTIKDETLTFSLDSLEIFSQ